MIKDNQIVGDIEFTTGNYGEDGNLIKKSIPTITTDFCEVGVYNDIIYLTFIIYSISCNKKLFDFIKNYSHIKIYGFKDFHTILYPCSDFNYQGFVEKIKHDKYLQIQFNYKYSELVEDKLYIEYLKLRNVFINSKVNVVNQLAVNLKEEKY